MRGSVISVITVSAIAAAPAAGQGWREMMHWGWMGSGMWILWILVAAFIIFIIARRAETPERPPEKPMDILRRRLAEGEISEEEFERLKKKIES